MRKPLAPLVLVLALSSAACEPGPSSSGAAPSSSVTANAASMAAPSVVASSPAATPAPPPPVCTLHEQKTWGPGANKLTGLTYAELPDKRVAVGFAFGTQPHVLILGRGGEGKVMKVPVAAKSALGNLPKPEAGTRKLLRVTPRKVEGETVQAFVDYRDEYKDKRRRVACGPADSDDTWIGFDGVSLLDRDPKPTGDERAALFKKKGSDGDEGYHELRDCRTFVDMEHGETLIVGSELHGEEKPDGTVAWKAALVVDAGPKTKEAVVHERELKGDPPKVSDFEVLVARELPDRSFLVAARFGGSLLAGLLNHDKTPRGGFTTYQGFPTIPDISEDGDDLVLTTSIAGTKGRYTLQAMRVPASKPALPRALTPVFTHEEDHGSQADPEFLRDSNGQRWIAYIEGERSSGRLEVVPIGADFRAVGRPFAVTSEKERAAVARLVPLSDGGLLVIYLRETEKVVELVTADLHCEVAK